jgi:hypothetical protein
MFAGTMAGLVSVLSIGATRGGGMHYAGSDTWSLNVSVDPMPLALYVRDSLHLDTSADELSPPPLIHPPPDRSDLLSPEEREEAGAEWAAWWRQVVHYDGAFHGAEKAGDFMAWYRPFAVERAAAIGEPPQFDALAGAPALHRAVIELFSEARTWSQSQDSYDAGPSALATGIAGQIAGEVAARHGVPHGRVRGVVLAYATKGIWWRVAEPGVLTCSIACVHSDEGAATAIRGVFESSLT